MMTTMTTHMQGRDMTQTHTNDRRLIIYDGPTRRKQLLRIGSELYSGVTNHLLATAVPRYLYATPSRQFNRGFRQPTADNWSSTLIVIEAKRDGSHLAIPHATIIAASYEKKHCFVCPTLSGALPGPDLYLNQSVTLRGCITSGEDGPSSKPESCCTSRRERLFARNPDADGLGCASEGRHPYSQA